MNDAEINEVAMLYRAGNTPREIAQMIGRSYTFVLQLKRQAHERGLLPPKKKTPPRQAVRGFVSNNGMKQGHISDVLLALSKDQQRWILREAGRLECESLAEYLTELVRDAHTLATQEKSK